MSFYTMALSVARAGFYSGIVLELHFIKCKGDMNRQSLYKPTTNTVVFSILVLFLILYQIEVCSNINRPNSI